MFFEMRGIMAENNNEKIEEFYNACCDMLNAKLILADVKISRILKTVMDSSDLISTIGETLINFNFDNEFSKAQVKNEMTTLYFELPSEKEKIIALVFGILSECDTHQIDLLSFIKDFFVDDSGDMSKGFTNFVCYVIFPFRDALCEMVGFSVKKEEEKVEEEEMSSENKEEQKVDKGVLNEFFDDVTTILTQIKESVNLDRKVKPDRKDELNITIDALLQSIELCNLKIMNALMISLNNLLQPIKSVRFYNNELQQRLVRFYSEL